MSLEQQIATILTDSLMEEIITIRRQLHQYPELSFQEYKTSETIRGLLDQWGIDYTFPHVETGIVARITGKKPGKRIALRADMDALPISERSGLAFSSSNKGVMHACGHDVHMASLLGTIRLLNQLKHEIQGEVLFLFQPGEELIPGGAKLMLEEDVFKDREPQMIIAQHILPEMEAGHVGFKAGMYMAANDEIYIRVKGKGGHAALRQQIKDPILMASQILLSLQQEIMSKAPGDSPTVLSFGKVLADGATNVIPDDVILEGTFRTMNEEWRKEAHGLIASLASNIATAMGGSVEVEIRHGYPFLYNNEQITGESKRLAIQLLGEEKVEDMDIRMTAEDFAWFTQNIPGMMYRFGVGDPGSEQPFSLHSPQFKVNESALRTGISLMSYLAIELLKIEAVEKINT
ncbi:MAG: amidohydrolase [Bacteroidetes bacterium]|nr:MAG: amidohydrolase [Bacteroidota bacterium]RLD70280.1 MAG: amidohydrolase [Bacteroidota bacterium]RLD91821.1 MAG: amidohydrolase [Bacteroidota bacterium]